MNLVSDKELLISVILPVFNGGQELQLAVQSIINQTYQNWELILMDDGSTDGAIETIKNINDPRIHILSDGVNKGLSHRLNEAIAATKGDYIARMDADDVSFPSRLFEQVSFLQEHPHIDLVGCRAVAFRNEGEIIGLLPFSPDHSSICSQPWRNIPLPHPTWMGRKDWFKNNPYLYPEVRRAEDQELLLRTYPNSQFACLDQILFGYRQGPFNRHVTAMARKSFYKEQLRLFKERSEWMNVVKATLSIFVKLTVDIVASLPGCGTLFFKRMGETVPVEAQLQLKNSLGL